MATIRDLTTELTTPAANDKIAVSDTSAAAGSQDKWMALSRLAVLSLTNTFTALPTFSAGISFGQDTLNYYDEGTWTPTITGDTNPTVSYTAQVGRYVRIGLVVFYHAQIQINTISGGSGNARFSLPVTSGAFTNGSYTGSVKLYDGASTHKAGVAVLPPGTSYALAVVEADSFVTCAELGAGKWIQYGGSYLL